MMPPSDNHKETKDMKTNRAEGLATMIAACEALMENPPASTSVECFAAADLAQRTHDYIRWRSTPENLIHLRLAMRAAKSVLADLQDEVEMAEAAGRG